MKNHTTTSKFVTENIFAPVFDKETLQQLSFIQKGLHWHLRQAGLIESAPRSNKKWYATTKSKAKWTKVLKGTVATFV